MQRHTDKNVVFFGDLVTDIVYHVERLPIEANHVQRIRSISVEPGGAGNSLIVAARLGANAVALGAIGEDDNGNAVVKILRDEGANMNYVQRGAGSVNMAVLVMVDDAGQHVFLVYEGRGDPFVLGERERALLQNASVFFIPGYALHEPRVGCTVLDALEIVVAANTCVMSDLGPIVNEESVRATALEVLRRSSVTFLTSEEAMIFCKTKNWVDAAEWMLNQGAQNVVIKHGANGCSVFVQGNRADIAGIPVDVKDTSGAGDSFAAGFIVDWLDHGDTVRAARFANAVGAAKVQKLGTGRQVPTREEIERMLKAGKIG
jgi:sugar/nucleoside kinase (ribokinase family)